MLLPLEWLLLPLMFVVCTLAFNAATDKEGRKEFISLDDEDNFLTNPGFKGFSREHLEWMWSANHLDVWEPVAWFFKAVIWKLFGTDEEGSAQGWLNSQIVLHATGAYVLFLVIRKILFLVYQPAAEGRIAVSPGPKTKCEPRETKTASSRGETRSASHLKPLPSVSPELVTVAAFAGALFWAIHPLRGETLGWISCSSYNIGSPFVFGSLLSYTNYVELQIRIARSGATPGRLAACALWYLLAVVCYFLGIACKTPAVAILVAFPVVDAFLNPGRLFPPLKWLRPQGGFFDKIPFAAVAVWCIQMASPKDDACGNERTPGKCLNAYEKFVRGMWALCFYVRMTVWPVQHQPHYALQKGPLTLDVNDYILPTVVVVTAFSISVFVFGQFVLKAASLDTMATNDQRCALSTAPVVAAALCLMYVTMSIPSLGFIQHGVPTMAADRYNYFSGAWVAVAVALLIVRLYTPRVSNTPTRAGKSNPLWDTRHVGIIFAGIVLVVLTRATTRAWTNTKSLYTYTLRFRDGASGFALNNYGYYYYRLEEWSRSEQITAQAIMVDPTQLKATINLADIYQYRTNELGKAIETYERGLIASPKSGSLVNNLIVAYAKADDLEMAAHMHDLVPFMQADWSDDADETMAWALQEKDRLRSVLVEPNVVGSSLSPIQQRLNAQCWEKAGSSRRNCLVRRYCKIMCLPSFMHIGSSSCALLTQYNACPLLSRPLSRCVACASRCSHRLPLLASHAQQRQRCTIC